MSLKEKLAVIEETKEKKNYQEIKEKWLGEIDKLYKDIKAWLEEYDTITYENSRMKIVEEFLGEYETENMEIYFGDKCAVLEPYGKFIIGGNGRIDFYLRGYIDERYILILYESGDKPGWYLFNGKKKKKYFDKAFLESKLEDWLS